MIDQINNFKETFEHVHQVRKNIITFCEYFNSNKKQIQDEIILPLQFNHNFDENSISGFISDLLTRAVYHDMSKFSKEEFPYFIKAKALKGLTYGSDEYFEVLNTTLKPGLENHYKLNNHHPEHYNNWLTEMSIVSIIEMLCDWKAATLRHADGDIFKSIEFNQERFKYSNHTKQIFINFFKLIKFK